MSGKRLVLASKNPGKIRELESLMAGISVEIIGLAPDAPDVEETGSTFEENALIKAHAACAATGLPALGEDSGLTVAALGGDPGIRSARWVSGSDADRMYALLKRMEGVPVGQRAGRYVSCIAMVTPDGKEAVVRGELDGVIGAAPRGEGGFGYDPIFVLPDGRSVADLSMAEKNAISHRARALAKALAVLPGLLEG